MADDDIDISDDTDGFDPAEIDLPVALPVFPLSGVILLPRNSLPLNIFEPRYLQMIRDAAAGNRMIGMIQPSAPEDDDTDEPPLYNVGCAGQITEMEDTPDGRILITLRGICRFEVDRELECTTPYRQVQASWDRFLTTDEDFPDDRLGLKRDALFDSLGRFLHLKGLEADFSPIREAPPEVLINTLSMVLPFADAEKQALLEAPDLAARTPMLISLVDMACLEIERLSDNDEPMNELN